MRRYGEYMAEKNPCHGNRKGGYGWNWETNLEKPALVSSPVISL